MNRLRTNCKVCNIPTRAQSGLCRKHSPFIGVHERTAALRRRLSKSLRKSSVFQNYHKSRLGKKRPEEETEKIRKRWADPILREQARIRGCVLANDSSWILKLSKALSGKNNPNWKGGVHRKPYAPGFTKKVKKDIRKRDNFTCQRCGKTEAILGYVLTIHHIDYTKNNHDPKNLISLCKCCNSIVNFNRKHWKNFFRKLLCAGVKI